MGLQNHRIERIWPEVNQRVNYPIKGALVELVDAGQLDIEDELAKYCVSNLGLELSEIGISIVLERSPYTRTRLDVYRHGVLF